MHLYLGKPMQVSCSILSSGTFPVPPSAPPPPPPSPPAPPLCNGWLLGEGVEKSATISAPVTDDVPSEIGCIAVLPPTSVIPLFFPDKEDEDEDEDDDDEDEAEDE